MSGRTLSYVNHSHMPHACMLPGARLPVEPPAHRQAATPAIPASQPTHPPRLIAMHCIQGPDSSLLSRVVVSRTPSHIPISLRQRKHARQRMHALHCIITHAVGGRVPCARAALDSVRGMAPFLAAGPTRCPGGAGLPRQPSHIAAATRVNLSLRWYRTAIMQSACRCVAGCRGCRMPQPSAAT